ncbi:MAG: hypothetical protein J5760_03945 [Clostridia bacterium]|nr:hypothetical protein [Clostridia bacterium]
MNAEKLYDAFAQIDEDLFYDPVAAKRRAWTIKPRRIVAAAIVLFVVGAVVTTFYLTRGGFAGPGDDSGTQIVQPSEQSATETDNNEPIVLFVPMLSDEQIKFEFDSTDDFNYGTIHEEEYMGTFKNYVIDGELYSFKYVRTMPLPFLEDYVLHYRYASEEKIIGLYVLKNDPECIVFRTNASLTQGFREEKCEEAQAFAIEMISRLYGEDVSKYSCEAVFVHETSPYKVRFYINDGLYRKYIGFCDIIESDDGLDYSSYFLVPKDVIDNIPTPPYTYEEIVSMTEKAAQKKKQGAEITDVSIRGYKYSHSKKCWALEYSANIEYEEDGVPHGGWIACYMFLDNDKQE